MIHDALGEHAAVGEFPPAVVRHARFGFPDGPAPALAALGEHAAVGEFPPAVVRHARFGFPDGPAPALAASARRPEGRAVDSPRGVIAAPTRAHRRSAVDRTDTAASC